MSRFELTSESKVCPNGIEILHRVRALVDMPGFGVRAGDLGGWVGDASCIRQGAWVGNEAEVYSGGYVMGEAYVGGHAVVERDGWVGDRVRVLDSARVSSLSEVQGCVLVDGDTLIDCPEPVRLGRARLTDALIRSSNDYMCVEPIGSEASTALLYRMRSRRPGNYSLSVGCWSGTVDELIPEAARRRREKEKAYPKGLPPFLTWDLWMDDYRALEGMCRRRIEHWKSD